MAGVYKIFQLGPIEHARKYFLPFTATFLPGWSVWFVGVTVPFVDGFAGGSLGRGLGVGKAGIALGAVFVVVPFGHLRHEPLFNFSGHVIPRLALLLFLLWCPREHDRYSLDIVIGRVRAKQD